MLTLYGLRNCDSCRRARHWLEARDVTYRFHDLRRDGLDAVTVDAWLDALGGDALVNRRGRTWRGLPEGERAATEPVALRQLLLRQPALVKRPLVRWPDGRVSTGFRPEEWQSRLP